MGEGWGQNREISTTQVDATSDEIYRRKTEVKERVRSGSAEYMGDHLTIGVAVTCCYVGLDDSGRHFHRGTIPLLYYTNSVKSPADIALRNRRSGCTVMRYLAVVSGRNEAGPALYITVSIRCTL
jgi:hypothetical protein